MGSSALVCQVSSKQSFHCFNTATQGTCGCRHSCIRPAGGWKLGLSGPALCLCAILRLAQAWLVWLQSTLQPPSLARSSAPSGYCQAMPWQSRHTHPDSVVFVVFGALLCSYGSAQHQHGVMQVHNPGRQRCPDPALHMPQMSVLSLPSHCAARHMG